MQCANCGKILPEGAMFCTGCGTNIEVIPASVNADIFCRQCGQTMHAGEGFCTNCGARVEATPVPASISTPAQIEQAHCQFCGEVLLPGEVFCTKCGGRVTLLEQKPVAPLPSLAKVPPPAPEQNRQQQPGLTFGGLFGEVTQKRAPDDWQGLLLSGTQGASDFWQKPWLFARVILGLGGAFLVTLILSGIFEQYSYGAQILPLMALALPLTICLFFWEANRGRDISLLSLGKFLAAGWALAFVVNLLGLAQGSRWVSIFIQIVYVLILQAGVVWLTASFARYHRTSVLTGVAIGAGLGAGIAAFTAVSGVYGFAGSLFDYNSSSLAFLFLNSLLHTVFMALWPALLGGAFMLVQDESDVRLDKAWQAPFLQWFGLVAGLQVLWYIASVFLTRYYY